MHSKKKTSPRSDGLPPIVKFKEGVVFKSIHFRPHITAIVHGEGNSFYVHSEFDGR